MERQDGTFGARSAPSAKKIETIVITGGPCAGKTTAMSWIQNAFTRLGYAVLFIDETATQLITGGAAPWLSNSNREFQKHLVQLQLDKEKAFTAIAGTMNADKVLIVCDRAALDNRAYMTEDEFRYVLRELGATEASLQGRYGAVFHLVTAAKGAEKFYTTANNTARTETPEQAMQLDDKLIAAWTGHPRLRVVDNSTDFEGKMRRLITEISSFLGEPEPVEIERKYLIGYPDTQELEKLPNCRRVDIEQVYLVSPVPGEELRIRRRAYGRDALYFMTRKRRISGMKRIEVQERLSRSEYEALLANADPECRPIRKQRYCLTENGLYYEIDVYPEWSDKAIMEVELHSETQQVVFPGRIRVIREVTGDSAYSNRELARRTRDGNETA